MASKVNRRSQAATNNTFGLPAIQPLHCRIKREYGGDMRADNLSVTVETLEHVTFVNRDGEPAKKSYRHAFEVTCWEKDSPEAFAILREAELGTKLIVQGFIRSKTCTVRSAKDGKFYPRTLAVIEATSVEAL